MKTDKASIFILLGFLLTLSHCFEIERALEFNGHKSGMYLIDNDHAVNEPGTGISYMFQKFYNKLAIHALFQYEYDVFAANITRNLLQNAIQSKLSKNGAKTKVDWKAFLEDELNSIGKRLMKPGVSDERAISKTSAAIVIVDGNTVTQARIGNVRIISFAYDSRKAKTHLRMKSSGPPALRNMLNGKYFEPRHSSENDIAEVTDLSDVRFIVMGTAFFWGVNDVKVAQILSQNENNLRIDAHNIAKLVETSDTRESNAVIVIGLNPLANISVPVRENSTKPEAEQNMMPTSGSNNKKKIRIGTRNLKKNLSLRNLFQRNRK